MPSGGTTFLAEANRALEFSDLRAQGAGRSTSSTYDTCGACASRGCRSSASLAIINNFLWNDAWTFRDVAKRQTGAGRKLRRFAKFQVVCPAGLALNTLLLNVQFNLLGMNRYVANAIAIAAVTAFNF